MIWLDQYLYRPFIKLTKCAVPDNFAIDISDDEEEPEPKKGKGIQVGIHMIYLFTKILKLSCSALNVQRLC